MQVQSRVSEHHSKKTVQYTLLLEGRRNLETDYENELSAYPKECNRGHLGKIGCEAMTEAIRLTSQLHSCIK